jgi:hypothetical protein
VLIKKRGKDIAPITPFGHHIMNRRNPLKIIIDIEINIHSAKKAQTRTMSPKTIHLGAEPTELMTSSPYNTAIEK